MSVTASSRRAWRASHDAARPSTEIRLKYDVKDFRESTSALLALEQGELEIANTTSQHLMRAISEGIEVVWIAGWGGGYNVLVASKGFDVAPDDDAALKAALLVAQAVRQAGESASRPVRCSMPSLRSI